MQIVTQTVQDDNAEHILEMAYQIELKKNIFKNEKQSVIVETVNI